MICRMRCRWINGLAVRAGRLAALLAAAMLLAGTGAASAQPIRIKVLAFNDFHGQLAAGRSVGGRPVGSAAVLAAYLKAAMAGVETRTFIVNAGDNIGASPLASALLRDEPTLEFLNRLGNRHCSVDDRLNPDCNLVSTPGNHEFDRGSRELLRQLFGGNHADGPFLRNPWRGVNHAVVSANVVHADDGRPLLPAFAVKRLRVADAQGGARDFRVAFIGALLRETPGIVPPDGVAGLRFLDEADAVNRAVVQLKAQGVRAIVLLIHQGGFQRRYRGFTRPEHAGVSGRIVDIVGRLDPEIDLVVSGHTHAFTNALLPAAGGTRVLVTQAFSAGSAFADIDLDLDPLSGDVVARRARIVTTYADEGPGLSPDAAIATLVGEAQAAVAPRAQRVIGRYTGTISRRATPSGESAMGNLIADAQRARMGTDIAIVNPGGIRAELRCRKGEVCEASYADVFAVQPLGNSLVKLQLTGEQIVRLLEQQFPPHQRSGSIRFLQVSGLSWAWDAARVDPETRACSACVTGARVNGRPLDPKERYTVAVNSFLAAGGDRFGMLDEGVSLGGGPLDVEVLADYLAGLPQPFSAPETGARIRRQGPSAGAR